MIALAVLGLAVAGDGASAAIALDPGAYVATTGSDTNACTKAAPCKSFDRAYRVALPGQVIEVAGGRYPAQTLSVDPVKTSTLDVIFRPAPGAAVVVSGALAVYGKHVEFADMKLAGGWSAKSSSVDLTFRNVSTPNFSIQSARWVNILGGEVGPWTANSEADPKIAKSSASNPTVPGQITIDGVRFHDIVRPAGSSYHIECLQIGAAAGLTIRNSTFDNCSTHAIYISSWGSGYQLSNISIQGNTFGTLLGGYHSLKVWIVAPGEPCIGCTISGNTAAKPIAVNATRTGSSITVSGNKMPNADLAYPGWCDHGTYGVTWTGNRFLRTPTCGTNATIGS